MRTLIQYISKSDTVDYYWNPNIISTVPKIGETVRRETNQLAVSYDKQVAPSSGNISIFKVNNQGHEDDLRQTVSAKSNLIKMADDGKGFSIPIFQSTFNTPSASYYFVLDNGFVKALESNEPLIGIQKGIWTVTTGNISNELLVLVLGSTFANLISQTLTKFSILLA